MSSILEDDSETEVVSRNLCGVVDIGSNGVRFSISSKAAHHARIMPCVFKDRLGISLYEVQFSSSTHARIPIPKGVISEICAAMKRFKLICEDFGVPESSVRVIATDATRDAINRDAFISAVYKSTGWEVEVLSQEEEGKVGIYSLCSSFDTASGLYLDISGGISQLSWIRSTNGEVLQSSTPVCLPYGASELTRRLKIEDKKELFKEIKEAYIRAIKEINIPDFLLEEAEREGGFELWTRGGGLRGLGHLLLSQSSDYPIQTIINGLCYSYEEFSGICDYLLLRNKIPNSQNTKIFKLSERRAQQLPAVGLFLCAVLDIFPKIKSVHFSEGGVREGTLYSILPREIRSQDPLVIASRPYSPLLGDKYLALLKTAIPVDNVPDIVCSRISPALCNLAFIHASYPKELQPTAALHVATRGIIAGCHGLSHRMRALIGIALCNRWGGNIPPTEEKYMQLLEEVVLRNGNKAEAKRIVWWTKYIGTIMYVICGVHPGGNIRDDVFDFSIAKLGKLAPAVQDLSISDPKSKTSDHPHQKHRDYLVKIRINKDDLKTSASVRARIITLQKKIRKLSRGSPEKVKVEVEFYDTIIN